jgi:sugar phosphate isomerase/epimerase
MLSARDLVSVSPLSTAELGLDADLTLYRDLDIHRAGLSMEKLEQEPSLEQALARVSDAGVRIDLIYPRQGVNLADAPTWDYDRDHLFAAVEVAAATGAPGVLVAGGGAHGLSWDDASAAFERFVAPVVERGRRHGVRLLLEPLRTQFAHLGFVHSLRDGVGVARRVGTGLVVDVTHCWWEPQLAETLQDNSDLIGTVQVADLLLDRPVTTRVVPGDGELPLARMLGYLLSAGYRGPFELELIGSALLDGGSEVALRRGVAHLESLLSSLAAS